MIPLQGDENLAYHAARLLILISRCGTPRRTPGIKGRTLLAKLDFFLRYPAYLQRAAATEKRNIGLGDIGVESSDELQSVESRMVRYRYGPWDHLYYPVLAYLLGKGLVEVSTKQRTELFTLTPKGNQIATALISDSNYNDLVKRADVIYTLFNRLSGSGLKDYIYKHFPEVVGLNLNERI